jgi:hypothetical protein
VSTSSSPLRVIRFLVRDLHRNGQKTNGAWSNTELSRRP